jgi:hypothetical protein
MNTILDLKTSNQYIINLLESNDNDPFIISRMGIGAETYITYEYIVTNKINTNYLQTLSNNAGIYNVNSNTILLYINLYIQSIQNSNALATFPTYIINEQSYFTNKYNLKQIHSRSLEPFYACLENIKPWTHYLYGKKVLIINPFIESMKKQVNNNFQIFKDPNKKIFLDNQEFIFYKSYQTSAGNHIHNDWLETYIIMCNNIKKLDNEFHFDIALLGCGGYGLPLCNFIKMELNKSAIYIGGGLQLLFGIMGHRWENRDDWKKIMQDNNEPNNKFIRPSGDEIINNKNAIENGCYW